ncbi:molybdenum cofactor biosynthesis protein [Alicyclobacillus contaminans]|uniref:MogA/MoaB family molybdenum cofactor biosynthesis protein n=1 Tax=Alicyclobacillus contaminans TaxID=392016 RepID=UPI00041E3B20|nr:MogA/MoaB family molybdenum cofactor biosynthesis protein [Alicyclobacillus contaminans]GMA51278.1 molybdenum cofactor biosynthesis protein [Alicyclobacillus contaminans]
MTSSASTHRPGAVTVITISDSAHLGTRRVDESGDVLEARLREAGFEVAPRLVVPDERLVIAAALRRLCTNPNVAAVFTTGGTGIGPRDVTPEATLDVVEQVLPGMAEAMRSASLQHTPHAMLSRQVAGIRNHTLIVNLPGSPKAVKECLEVVLPVLPHTLQLLSGRAVHQDVP